MRSSLTGSSAAIVFLLLATASASAQTEGDAASAARVSALLAQMTPEEKVEIVRGKEEPAATSQGQAGYIAGVPRLGIPAMRFADGPPGVVTRKLSVAEVATMGVAATFDTDLAYQNGVLIADEARRLGIDVSLQPFVNIDRDITFGRGYNTFGEDPVLAGAMGAAEVRGIQSRGVMAMAKHFVGFDTDAASMAVDPQTLREVYIAPFAEASDAGLAAIMCAYNKINGRFACDNHDILTGILRDEVGFKGFVTSDWGAVHGSGQLAAGLDMEMPGVLTARSPFAGITPSYFDITPAPHRLAPARYDVINRYFSSGIMPEEPQGLLFDMRKGFPQDTKFRNASEALRDGVVTTAMYDVAAGRILGQMDRFGLLRGSPKVAVPPALSKAEQDDINERTAVASAVLLKNVDDVLPLSRKDLGTLAMIGPGAAQTVAVGTALERSPGIVERQVSPITSIRRASGGEAVVLAVANDMTGTAVPAGNLGYRAGAGLLHTESGGKTTVDADVNFTSAAGTALPAGTTHRWNGVLRIASGGEYLLNLQLLGARGTMAVDGKHLAGTQSDVGMLHGDTVHPNEDNLLPTTDGLDNVRAAITLSPGDHPIEIETRADGSGVPVQVRLAWSTPAMRRMEMDKAVTAASKAGKAVVFAWSRGRPAFVLPGEQDALISAVAAANPNTVVVLNVSQPVAMPWLDKVKGVLVMWWAGDQGGPATTDLLVGRQSPSGRLPFTWGKRLADYPATGPAHPERSAAGVNGITTYSEGLDVGYRWFERQGTKPLFPFGYGLSYSRFTYSDLAVRPSVTGGMDVTFKLGNVGSTAASEVAQVYLGPPATPPTGARFAVKAFAGFVRVPLAAGETKSVSVHLPERRFQYWSVAAGRWMQAKGERRLMVGSSSTDIMLKADVDAGKR